MTRRQFGFMGLSGAGLAALSGVTLGQERERRRRRAGEKEPEHLEHDSAMRDCAKACSDCERECETCATHCAHMMHEGKKEHLTTLMTCQDCATFCIAAAKIVARGGPFAQLICQGCAEACSRCGKECEKFPDDQHMKLCAEECRKCEKACNDMVKQTERRG